MEWNRFCIGKPVFNNSNSWIVQEILPTIVAISSNWESKQKLSKLDHDLSMMHTRMQNFPQCFHDRRPKVATTLQIEFEHWHTGCHNTSSLCYWYICQSTWHLIFTSYSRSMVIYRCLSATIEHSWKNNFLCSNWQLTTCPRYLIENDKYAMKKTISWI